jgi:hypothetical protein
MLMIACGLAMAVMYSIFVGAVPPVSGLVAIGVVLSVAFWLIRAHLPAILLVFVTVLLAGTVITRRPPKLLPDRIETKEAEDLGRRWAASGPFNQRLPIVMHLIFDEMMSTGAMSGAVPGGLEMRETLMDFAKRHSLRVYDSVYSRHYFSGESIPAMMNEEYLGRTRIRTNFGEEANVPANAYFDDMAARGYRTVVFQTALLDYCLNKHVVLCETFDSFDPTGKGSVGIDARNQRANLWQTIVRADQPSFTSEAGQAILSNVYGLKTSEVGVLGTADRYDAQRFPEWFDRFARFATTVPRGTHVFAHFMVPHSPYLLSENCIVSGRFEGGYYLSKYPEPLRSAKRRQFYDGYFSQLRCVQRKLDEFMTAIESSPNYRDAVIIIHGDHGSRISSGNLLADYTERDFIDNYGAFFAVRAPQAAPGIDCQFTSLPEIFRRYAGRPRQPPPTGPPLPVLVLNSESDQRVVEVPMPVFGCASQNLTQ